MNLEEKLKLLNTEYSDFEKYFPQFVPYIYLDGHRTSCLSDNESVCYKSGLDFYFRLSKIFISLGGKDMVAMIYNSRNIALKERVLNIQKTIIENINPGENLTKNFRFYIYGNTDVMSLQNNEFAKLLSNVLDYKPDNPKLNHHLLVNYSEDWAIENLDKINLIPPISSSVRFTKGYISGGWIPLKMKETLFIYSQLPSVSEYWSDDAILYLLLISFVNWLKMSKFIGRKTYNKEEKENIHRNRDLRLKNWSVILPVYSKLANRIIAFDENGPIFYEIQKEP